MYYKFVRHHFRMVQEFAHFKFAQPPITFSSFQPIFANFVVFTGFQLIYEDLGVMRTVFKNSHTFAARKF